MTNEIDELLQKMKNHELFSKYKFLFIGGTALSYYLNHRISYDIDFAFESILPHGEISSLIYTLGGKAIPDKNSASFRINTGHDIKEYHLKFMLNGVKIEFSYFTHPIQKEILKNSEYKSFEEGSFLKILSLNDIIKLKMFAFFNREKTRDLFDIAFLMEKDFISYEEIEQFYSFCAKDGVSLRDYLKMFGSSDDDGDNSLDFISTQEYYKKFAKKEQTKRFLLAKEMFLEQYDKKQKSFFQEISKNAIKNKG